MDQSAGSSSNPFLSLAVQAYGMRSCLDGAPSRLDGHCLSAFIVTPVAYVLAGGLAAVTRRSYACRARLTYWGGTTVGAKAVIELVIGGRPIRSRHWANVGGRRWYALLVLHPPLPIEPTFCTRIHGARPCVTAVLCFFICSLLAPTHYEGLYRTYPARTCTLHTAA